MKHWLMLTSRASLEESALDKFHDVIKSLKSIEPPWGIDAGIDVPFSDFMESSVASQRLGKFFGNGITANLGIRYRNALDNHHSSDDRFVLGFNPKKVDYAYLVNVVFLQYIEIFNAYSAEICSQDIINSDFEKSRYKNYRNTIIRFCPVGFYDEELCISALKKKPKEIVKILFGEVYKAELFGKGVIIEAGTLPLSLKESDEFDNKVRSLLSL